jgi:hypothetical protein
MAIRTSGELHTRTAQHHQHVGKLVRRTYSRCHKSIPFALHLTLTPPSVITEEDDSLCSHQQNA